MFVVRVSNFLFTTLALVASSFVNVNAQPATAQEQAITAAKAKVAEDAADAKGKIDARVIMLKTQIDAANTGKSLDAAQQKSIEAQKAKIDMEAANEKARIDAQVKVFGAALDHANVGKITYVAVSTPSFAGSSRISYAVSNGNGDGERDFHSFVIGLCDYFGVDRAKFMALIHNAKAGTSREAIAMIESARRVETVNAVLKDDRLVGIINAGVAGGVKAYFEANPVAPAPVAVTDDRIREVAGDVVAPVREAVVEMGDSAAKLAEQVAVLGATQVTDTRSRLFGIGKKTEQHAVNPEAAAQASSLAAQIRAAQEKARTGK